MSYYNTSELQGDNLAIARANAKSQDKMVLYLAEKMSIHGKMMTARSIWRNYRFAEGMRGHGSIMLTSVRRSINTLIKLKLLEYARHENGRFVYHESTCPVDKVTSRERVIQINESNY